MGGSGSGRPSGSGRSTIEACRSIDVNRLHREGCLGSGWAGGWQWQREGENIASINLRAEVDRLHLSYRVLVCLLYTSPSPRDRQRSRMPSSA